ncbi:hypothetical protein LCGC14_0745800 [marine sediment metagenome]|uniref:Uncharacterized protein n=1 Tax=marine sediment metagenome TaxID=412755 RepID=A0A0F9SQF6_9ZZZZ
MKNKFFTVYFLLVLSTIFYTYISSIASKTQEQFYFLLSFGLMISMFFFLCTLATQLGGDNYKEKFTTQLDN